jgi:hypothetical protein
LQCPILIFSLVSDFGLINRGICSQEEIQPAQRLSHCNIEILVCRKRINFLWRFFVAGFIGTGQFYLWHFSGDFCPVSGKPLPDFSHSVTQA